MATANRKRPKNLRRTFGKLLSYMGMHKFLLAAVAVTVLEIFLFWLHFRRREVKL